MSILRSEKLKTALGVSQFTELSSRFSDEVQNFSFIKPAQPDLILIALLLIFLSTALAGQTYTSKVDISTLALGVCTILGLIACKRAKVPLFDSSNFGKGLKLVHTAFALGCIPAVVMFLLGDLPSNQLPFQSSTQQQGPRMSIGEVLVFAAIVSFWAAATEEILFRGLFIGVLRRIGPRRWPYLTDSLLILASAMLFSLSHLARWGPEFSFAHFGLGVGFGIGYLASGERLLPLLVYHFLFDFAAILVLAFI